MYNAVKWFLRMLFSWPIYVDLIRHDHKITGGKIFTANHPSTLDPVMIWLALDEQVSILITQGVFDISPVGLILRLTDHIPVIDGQGNKAYGKALQMLRSGKNILIFPEGTLSKNDGSTNPPFSGAVRLALETGSPIIPIGISFSKDKTFRKKILIKNRVEHAKFYFFGRYNITVGKPLMLNGKISDISTVNKYKKNLMEKIDRYSEESAVRLFSG